MFRSCDVVDTSVLLHTSVISLVYNVTDTNCWAHNGCTHCGVFRTFKHKIFFKQTGQKNGVRDCCIVFMSFLPLKNCCENIFHIIPVKNISQQFLYYSYLRKTAVFLVFMLFLSVENCYEHSFHVIPISEKLL